MLKLRYIYLIHILTLPLLANNTVCQFIEKLPDNVSKSYIKTLYSDTTSPVLILEDKYAYRCLSCNSSAQVRGSYDFNEIGGASDEATVGGVFDGSTVGGASDEATVGGAFDGSSVGGASDKATVGGAFDGSSVGGASDEATVGGAFDGSTVGGASDEATVGGVFDGSTVGGTSDKNSINGKGTQALLGGKTFIVGCILNNDGSFKVLNARNLRTKFYE